ncbi:hypothetical protein [Mycolicibacterium sp. A43C]
MSTVALTQYEALHSSNARRTASAAPQRVRDAESAIAVLTTRRPLLGDRPLHDRYLRALQLRVEHPTLSFAELAAQSGQTKDAYAGDFRRALAYARSLKTGRRR